MSRLVKILTAAFLVSTGVAIDRYALIPLEQAQVETISNPNVAGRVIHRMEANFGTADKEGKDLDIHILEYHVLTGDGKEFWAISPTLVKADGKYRPTMLDSNGNFDPGKLPDFVLKVGQDVRLKFDKKTEIPGFNRWVQPLDEYGERFPKPKENSIVVLDQHEIAKPVTEADNGFYAQRSGMVIERNFHRHVGKTENVVLEEYVVLESSGRTWHFAKSHPFPTLEDKVVQRVAPEYDNYAAERKLRWNFNPPAIEQRSIGGLTAELEDWDGRYQVKITPILNGNTANLDFGVKVAGKWFYRLAPNKESLIVHVDREEFIALQSSGKPIEQAILYQWVGNELLVYSSLNNGTNPKIQLLERTRTPRNSFLFNLGDMVSISPEQFFVDDKPYFQKEEDGFGTRTQKLVSGIGDFKTIKYSQARPLQTAERLPLSASNVK